MAGKLMELITGEDNSTLEPAYVWWALSLVIALGLEVYSVLTGVVFDMQAYGIGIGALLAGAGWSKRIGS